MTDRRLVRRQQAQQYLPIGRSQWYQWVKEGRLPQPIKIGRAAFYDLDELQAAIRRLIEDSARAAA